MPLDGVSPPRTVAGRLTAILLTFRSGSSHSLTEIAALTGMPMSTVHRLTSEMASRQLLRRGPDGRYRIGPNLQQLVGDVERMPSLEERAALVVTDLCDATQRRARFGVLSGGRVAYAEKRWGAEAAVPLGAGATLPAHATALGKAVLAFAPRSAVAAAEQRLTRFTARTVTEQRRLLRQLQVVRLTGFAQSRGELVRGDHAIAAPVFGPGGVVIAAIELQVRDLREDLARYRPTLTVTARGLSRELALTGHEQGRHLRSLRMAADDPGVRPLRAVDEESCDTIALPVRGVSSGT